MAHAATGSTYMAAASARRATMGLLGTLRTSLLDHLVLWVLAAVAVGLSVPGLGRLQWLVLPVLFVMVGSITLTLDPRWLAGAPWATAAGLMLAGVALPAAAWGASWMLDVPEGLALGLVVFFAAPPELTTPVLTRVARGHVALSAATLLLASLAALAVAPGAVALAGGEAAVMPLARSVAAAVVLPMAIALTIRGRGGPRLAAHDDTYAAVSAAMLVLVMLLVAGQSRDTLLGEPRLVLLALAVGVPIMLLAGGAGRLLVRAPGRSRAAAFSLGIRDFAVAAALIVAGGLPPEGAVAALSLGIAELVGGTWLAGRWRKAPLEQDGRAAEA